MAANFNQYFRKFTNNVEIPSIHKKRRLKLRNEIDDANALPERAVRKVLNVVKLLYAVLLQTISYVQKAHCPSDRLFKSVK